MKEKDFIMYGSLALIIVFYIIRLFFILTVTNQALADILELWIMFLSIVDLIYINYLFGGLR